jgi:hypothetical protein
MHVYGKRSQGPSWMTAVVIFVLLLITLQVFRGRTSTNRPLEQQFAASPPEPGTGRLVLPPLPSSVAGLARTAAARISAGSRASPLTPVAESSRLRVEITGLETATGGLHITGFAANIGAEPFVLSLGAFRFTDGSGMVYATENDAGTSLEPGTRVPLDLMLPIADPRELILDVELAGDAPLRMVLLQEPATP